MAALGVLFTYTEASTSMLQHFQQRAVGHLLGFRSYSPSDRKLQQVQLALSDGDTRFCDVSTGVQRPFVPAKYRRWMFNVLHSLAPPGISATPRLVTQCFVWPSINADVRRWARSCQCAKVHRYATLLQAHSLPRTLGSTRST